MTVINGKRVILVTNNIRVVIDVSSYAVETKTVDATGQDAWTSFNGEDVESALVEVIRRHDRAEMIDDGLCDLREDVKPAPPAPVAEAFSAPLTERFNAHLKDTSVVLVEDAMLRPNTPRFKLVRPDEVPVGVAAEYYSTDVTTARDYVIADNLNHDDFHPAYWPYQKDSTWACMDTWGIQHPSNSKNTRDEIVPPLGQPAIGDDDDF